jgi:hypothetical protein
MNTEAEGSPSPFLAVMDSLQCDKGTQFHPGQLCPLSCIRQRFLQAN